MMKVFRNATVFSSAALLAMLALPRVAPAQAAASDTILTVQAADKLLPDSVYFAGQSANTQMRNAAGVQFADGQQTLTVLVDTSGYSSALQQKYQGYLITETALDFGGHQLAPGAYGFGFVQGQFLVMDIGSHDLLQTACVHDAQMHLPRPLQILGGSAPGTWRLCSGRDCVTFGRAH
jgi:hypothetical protein